MTVPYLRFTTETGTYLVAVGNVREVVSARKITPLPAPRRGVAGVIHEGDDVITIVAVLGRGRDHVVVVTVGDALFGLYTLEVTGVIHVDEAELQPPPVGQALPVIDAVRTVGDDAEFRVAPELIWQMFGG